MSELKRSVLARLAGTAGAALVGFLAATTATPRTIQDKLRESVSAEDFGWPAAGEVAINAAIAALAVRGGGCVRVNTPGTISAPIVLASGVYLKGLGRGEESLITVAAGVAIDACVTTPNFEALYDNQPGSTLNGVLRDCGLIDIAFNGNKANVPAVTNWKKGLGLRCLWIRPVLENVAVWSTPGIGVISVYPSAGVMPGGYSFPQNLRVDAKIGGIDGLYIHDTEFEGMVFEGPSDLSVNDVFVGWPAGSLQNSAFNAAKKSLKFTTGGLVAVGVTNGGANYSATPTITINDATGAGAAVEAVVIGGVIDHIIIDTEGFSYTAPTFTVTDATGAGAVLQGYVDNTCDGLVFNDQGAELNFVHAFNNANGWAINFRSSSNGFPRITGRFVMGESSLGNVRIGGHTRYQIACLDTHSQISSGGPAVYPSLVLRSDRGGSIGSASDYRSSTGAMGTPSFLVAGFNNRIDGGAIFGQGKTGDGVVLTGTANAVKASVTSVAGTALVTDQGIQGCDAAIVSNANAAAWKNIPQVSSLTSRIAVQSSGVLPSQYIGLNSFAYQQWRNVSIADKRTDTQSFMHSSQVVYGNADATSTVEQAIVINHAVVRTPAVGDCFVKVKPNTGATLTPLLYAYVASATATAITVKLRFSAAGVGTATTEVNIG